MDARIKGSFPGGPRRTGEGEPTRPPPRLRTVAEIEQGLSRRSLERARGRRGRLRWAGALLVIVLGFAAGAALGLATHTTPQEVTEALDSERQRDAEISREVNRVLLELWRMEDVEALRNRSRVP